MQSYDVISFEHLYVKTNYNYQLEKTNQMVYMQEGKLIT